MPTLSIRFIGGHYHATPWDKAQNEGAVEWPPSPWRLLRALIATGYAKLPEWLDGTPPPLAKSLIEHLATALPSYKLPPATGAHTRHYMPTNSNPTLVLDSRAVLGSDHEPMLVHWPVELTQEEQSLFDSLAVRLSYLGRAESWTECESIQVPTFTSSLADGWTIPHDDSTPLPSHCDQIPLIAPVSSPIYSEWVNSLPKPKNKKLAPAPSLFCALQVETSWLQKHGWSAPPGSRLVIYDHPSASAISIAPTPKANRPARPTVPFVLLALSSSARSRSPMPLRERTLPQAELLHQAITSKVQKLANHTDTVSELIGLDAVRKPTIGHRHAHILPLTLLNADNHLDHILIWTPGGLSESSQNVLRSLRKTYMKGGVGEVEVRFAGSGTREEFKKIPALNHILGEAKVWQSLTPFLLPRHPKKNGRNTIEGQITEELTSRSLPSPKSIEILREESIGFRHFVRARRKGARPPEDFGYALRLTFPISISGPIAIGHSSHFGLGLFVPADQHSSIP
ncbi:type I-U CRISPR-associated protein Cas5/Cas6 [Phragmitibacter flavus]|uniref:Type I-U CRISPR-associated protein Cas5/Cas6 n=1 Tax=Phragmitibacter flavus TaxID=2576071 RepID=A0A5R8K942_9BACT|nr:type I-U CRISPR-associated protein Csb2 [Phragmitibacter flavus]TLD68811.1 type I-U CRISPR-associated protein Cas5/Cas6 [Phragmitibacter flavus]